MGRFEQERFVCEASGILRHGSGRNCPYPETDEQGRFIVLWNNFHAQHIMSSAKEDTKRGFAGAYALPQSVSLRPDRSLAFEPIPGIAELRGKRHGIDDAELMPGEVRMIEGADGAQLEVGATLEAAEVSEFGVVLAGGNHRVEVRYDARAGHIELDLRHVPFLPIYGKKGPAEPKLQGASSEPIWHAWPASSSTVVRAPLILRSDEALTLRVFFDGSIVEVYANGITLMDWALFERPDQVGAGVFARGGTARIRKVDAWQMGTIWPDYVNR